eukprot:TRINITY_DN40399_c0_g1_i1.p1 TRINITY_DN40399_c0_g1~~TRINITY_DN40399_c0_g1_i1.p1  ORF type:complete len:331 (+),score=103.42 TRINITY_DN40399_c0_g1_i1:96-995(+)
MSLATSPSPPRRARRRLPLLFGSVVCAAAVSVVVVMQNTLVGRLTPPAGSSEGGPLRFPLTHYSAVTDILVIPGGGPGAAADKGLPVWTKARCDAAAKWFARGSEHRQLILTLSAGSMNAPNARDEAGAAVFESAAAAQYLHERHGIARDRIAADFVSWDTVANAWYVRMVLDALAAVGPHAGNVDVHLFISDFHRKRCEAALRWVLGLPPVRAGFSLHVHELDTSATFDHESAEWAERMRHEARSAESLLDTASSVRTLQDFQAWLLLGGHQGYYQFTHGVRRAVSKGLGWGGSGRGR